MEDSVRSFDIMPGHKNNINARTACESLNNTSPKCTRSKQGSELFSDVVRMFF